MAAPKRRRLNAQIAAHIKWLLATTTMFQHEIAALLGINQGRVSEVKNGKRFKNVPPSDHFPDFA